jgi:hypothetical protein
MTFVSIDPKVTENQPGEAHLISGSKLLAGLTMLQRRPAVGVGH